MIMKNKFAALSFATLILFAAGFAGCGQKKPELSAADQKKVAALNLAFKSGVLTQQEYDAKMKAITAGAAATSSSPANSGASNAATAQKLQALENACTAGVFTPEECASKRAAITGSSGSGDGGNGVGQLAPPTTSSQDGASAPDNSGATAQPDSGSGDNGGSQGGAGSAYSDPSGNFTLNVPQGWSATPQGQNGGAGVQMGHNRSWALVAPFSGVNQPGDVVNNVATQIHGQYQNFTLGQHGNLKLNGFDAAVATFSGTNGKGVPVTVVIMGVAGPNGRYYAVMSSVPQGEEQNENPSLSAMVQSIRFAGQ